MGTRTRPSPLAAGLFLATWGLAVTLASAAERAAGWLTGVALQRQLAEPIGVYWQGVPLRQAVRGLADLHRVAVIVDRRIDPDQKLQRKVDGVPLGELLREVGEELGFAVANLGPAIYLGPPEAAAKLRTLALLRREDAYKLPREAGQEFIATARFAWADFATPRGILAELDETSGVRIFGVEQVPHDLWAAAELPPLSFTDRLSLIAIQFDLTFEIAAEGKAVRLVPVPEEVSIVREYPGGRDPKTLMAKWAELAPNCRFREADGKIFVRGPVEEHDRIAASRSPQIPRSAADHGRKAAAAGPGETRFTVKETRGQLGSLLKNLAKQLGLELRIDEQAMEQAGISLQQPITFSVTEGTEDDLLRAICQPAGCTFRRQGRVIEVRPK